MTRGSAVHLFCSRPGTWRGLFTLPPSPFHSSTACRTGRRHALHPGMPAHRADRLQTANIRTRRPCKQQEPRCELDNAFALAARRHKQGGFPVQHAHFLSLHRLDPLHSQSWPFIACILRSRSPAPLVCSCSAWRRVWSSAHPPRILLCCAGLPSPVPSRHPVRS